MGTKAGKYSCLKVPMVVAVIFFVSCTHFTVSSGDNISHDCGCSLSRWQRSTRRVCILYQVDVCIKAVEADFICAICDPILRKRRNVEYSDIES